MFSTGYSSNLAPGVRLSGLAHLDPILAISVPLAGGIAFGIARELITRWRPEREIDPIEANALHGGRMSLLGSIIVAAETVWSSGVGASVGQEAGYTQFAGGVASRLGMAFRLRRADLRILVGCGAAGGIAGAFGAPLAGAFYGFELIIGGYSPNSLAPVAVSALIGYLVAHALAATEVGIVAPTLMTVAPHDLVISAAIGVFCAAAGILTMRGVAVCEALFVRSQAAAGAAHRYRRTSRRPHGDGGAAGDVVRSRRIAIFRNAATFAVDRGAAVCSENRGVDRLTGIRISWRAVLFVVADGRLRRPPAGGLRWRRSCRAGISTPTPMP